VFIHILRMHNNNYIKSKFKLVHIILVVPSR
jgi:hypothetical protein